MSYNAMAIPTLNYRLETWVVVETDKNTIQSAECNLLDMVVLDHRNRNDKISNKFKLKYLVQLVPTYRQ